MLGDDSLRLPTGLALRRALHHPPKAKRVVQLFMAGAASHIDLFDYKPELVKRHGQPCDFGEPVEAFQNGLGPWLKPIWDFKPYGNCGKLLSEPVAPLGEVVDEIAFVHNVVGKTGVHSQATLLQATGFQLPGFPGMGSWVSYGLGSLNDNLPTFVVLPDHRGLASNGTKNWDSAFLPAQHSGTVIYPGSRNADRRSVSAQERRLHHASQRSGRAGAARPSSTASTRPSGRATRGSKPASAATSWPPRCSSPRPKRSISRKEPEHILKLYGLDQHARCSSTRRSTPAKRRSTSRASASPRGGCSSAACGSCRSGPATTTAFRAATGIRTKTSQRDHGPLAAGMARGAAALIQDLKQRGLLDDTIILWTTEFGRMPSSQGGKGRDHNPYCFTNWLCGGGIKGGITYGPSDEWGYKPLDREHPTQVYDIHATILHLLGIDHTRLTVRHNGIDRRLTDVHGHVIRDILA